MENLKYISVHQRACIVDTYIKVHSLGVLNDDEFAVVEAFLFEDPTNRRLIDKGIEKADSEVDLERYSQYSEAWYQDVIKDLPEPVGILDSIEGKPNAPEEKRPKDYIQTVEGYRQFRNKVDEILEEFDFARVHKVMESLDWHWGFWDDRDCCEHRDEIPNEYALRKMARKLLIDVVEYGHGGTGGFETVAYVYSCNPDNEPDDFEHQVCLALKFVVESFGEV